jgi:hypothetical protein
MKMGIRSLLLYFAIGLENGLKLRARVGGKLVAVFQERVDGSLG